MLTNVLKEALVIGIITMIVGLLLHLVSLKLMGKHDLNDLKMFAGHLFGIGIIVHILMEYTKANKWYCKHGNACATN